MATESLKGLWGFEALDRTGITTWKLGLVIIAVFAALGYLLMAMIRDLPPNPELGAMSPMPLIFLWATIAGFIVLYLALARTTEADLEALASIDPAVSTSIAKLNPGRAFLAACIAFQFVLQALVVPVLVAVERDLSLVEATVAILEGGHQFILGVVLFPIVGLVLGVGMAIVLNQIVSLTHAAGLVRIDLLRLNTYAAIADPTVRLFLYMIPILSALPLLMVSIEDPVEVANVTMIALVFLFFVGLVLLAYAYPVWLLRNRIREVKETELELITRALQGDAEALASISLHTLERPTTATDLLTQRMFIDSLWEWPIASHVQKIILFGLLPPITWVLASMIENAMY